MQKQSFDQILRLQVWPKDGHVDHRVLPQCSPGRGGCLPAGWQALCCGWIWWPVISEHCRVLRCTEQWVDWGNHINQNWFITATQHSLHIIMLTALLFLYLYYFRHKYKHYADLIWCRFCFGELLTLKMVQTFNGIVACFFQNWLRVTTGFELTPFGSINLLKSLNTINIL